MINERSAKSKLTPRIKIVKKHMSIKNKSLLTTGSLITVGTTILVLPQILEGEYLKWYYVTCLSLILLVFGSFLAKLTYQEVYSYFRAKEKKNSNEKGEEGHRLYNLLESINENKSL